jgi:hypothetical protein
VQFAKSLLAGAKNGKNVGKMSNIAANGAGEINKLQICSLH